MEFEDRIYKVLWAVVDSYITSPDPVGSRFVSRKYAFNLSPATIRNVMADLEEMGFLRQPHTSAGRVPTDKGYRFYVDSLASQGGNPSTMIFDEIARKLEDIRDDITILLQETTRMLSAHSHYIGFALSPSAEKTTLRWINLYRYKKNHIIIVLLTDEGIITNKIMPLDSSITDRDIEGIEEYLNSKFSGLTLDEIKSRILIEMHRDKTLCDSLISQAITICREALAFDHSTVFVSGLSEVLGLPDFTDLERIREISKAIEDKHLIIKLLDTLAESEGVQVVIGSESPAAEMRKLSMVVSTYKEGDKPIGTVGVIGPTRMDYIKAISLVDTTAKLITRFLSGR